MIKRIYEVYFNLTWKIILLFILNISCHPQAKKTSFMPIINVKMPGDSFYSTIEDAPVKVAYDIKESEDSVDLKLHIESNPEHGKLFNCDNTKLKINCWYQPNRNFHGTDSFKVYAKDGGIRSKDSRKVIIQVASENDAPVIGVDQTISLVKNTSITFDVNESYDDDTSKQALTYHFTDSAAFSQNESLLDCFNLKDSKKRCTFTPPADYIGSDYYFKYKVRDTGGIDNFQPLLFSESDATVRFIVLDKNTKPIIGDNQTINILQGNTISFNVNQATDADSSQDLLSYHIMETSSPLLFQDKLTCFQETHAKRTCSFTAPLDYHGSDYSFKYKVRDSGGTDVTNFPPLYSDDYATVTFNIIKANTAPIIGADQNITLLQDTTISFDVNEATDADSDQNELNYQLYTGTNGTLDCFNLINNKRRCQYTPPAGYFGNDYSLKYKVQDKGGQNVGAEILQPPLLSSGYATVNFTVVRINTAPIVGSNQTIDVVQGETISFDVNEGIDSSNSLSSLTYHLYDSESFNTTKGILNCFTNPSAKRRCTYTAPSNYYGSDYSFKYKVRDTGGTNILNIKEQPPLYSQAYATIQFNIIKLNSAPIVGPDQTVSLIQGETITFNVNNGSDVETSLNQLTYHLHVSETTPAEKGVLSCFDTTGLSRQCTYTAPLDYYGNDYFVEYKVRDSGSNLQTQLYSNQSAKIKFNIIKRNKAPIVGADQTIEVKKNHPMTFEVNTGYDEETPNDFLIYHLVETDTISNGIASLNCFNDSRSKRTCTFTPPADYFGKDYSFKYKVKDAGYGLNNQPPKESESFATVTFDVLDKNFPPTVGENQIINLYQGDTISFDVNEATDIDTSQNLLTYHLFESDQFTSEKGTLNCFNAIESKRRCTYTAPSDYFGNQHSFKYKVKDTGGGDLNKNPPLYSNSYAEVTFNIIKINKAPIIGADQIIDVNQGSSITFYVSEAIDEETSQDSLTYHIIEPETFNANKGVLDCFSIPSNRRKCTYTPPANYFGNDYSFQYNVKDTGGASISNQEQQLPLYSKNTATVNFNIKRINRAPMVGSDQIVNVYQNTPITFDVEQATDSDTPSQSLTYILHDVSKVIAYQSSLNCFALSSFKRRCIFTPPTDYYGSDITFKYKVRDTGGDDINTQPPKTSSSYATVSFNVLRNMVNDFTRTGEIQKTDILWVVDNSGSMYEEQQLLADSFEDFIQDFILTQTEFKMAITTTDTTDPGLSQEALPFGKLVTGANNITNNFMNMVSVGTRGSASEMGLANSLNFMKRYDEYNYFRPDSYLAIIYISDEEDSSSGSVEYIVDELKSFKSKDELIKIYSIVNKSDDSTVNEGYKGKRYEKASKLTNGTISSIKDNFAQVLSNLGTTITNLNKSFALSETPFKESEILVFVDGLQVDTGWYYEKKSNSIVFTDEISAGSQQQIKVRYAKSYSES